MKFILRKCLIIICKIRQLFLFSSDLQGKNRVALSTKIKSSKLGYGTYVGPDSEINNCIIGKFSCIGPRVKTIVSTHPINFISMHPAFYSTDLQAGFSFVKEKKYNDFLGKIYIGNDVWIGSDVLILGNIKIGDGVIVGAGSVVTKSIEPYTIVAGVPARKIRDRFSDKKKKEILREKWWDKDINWIKENLVFHNEIKKC
ncbi:MAG: CatB-related O-acetyltransferase [Cetobacterium sp.]